MLGFLPSMSILSFFAYSFRFYFVSADHDQLRFGCALWSVRLNLADIAQIEETNIKWIKWGGQGSRLKSLKRIGYITGNGPGIHLVLSTGREYTFNCDDPVACITAFQTKTADDERQVLAVGEQTIVAQLETSIADEELEKSIDSELMMQKLVILKKLEKNLLHNDQSPTKRIS